MADARPTFPTALAIAAGGSAVAEALRAHGVVRVTRALSKSEAAALMEAVDLSLADALQATKGNEIDSEQWQSRFGDIMSPRNRHDVKLSLEAPPVRAALASLLGTLEPALSASLGEDALLHELAALISLPGARRQPIHPDTPIKEGSGTDQGPVILTGFCALQDIDASMGPTLFLPSTHTAEAHAAFFTYENFDLYISSTSDEDEDELDAEHETRVSAQLESLEPWHSELCTGDVSLAACTPETPTRRSGGGTSSTSPSLRLHTRMPRQPTPLCWRACVASTSSASGVSGSASSPRPAPRRRAPKSSLRVRHCSVSSAARLAAVRSK